MASLADLQLWQSLDDELVSLLDNFSNLIRAANVPDEETEHSSFSSKEAKKAPGDLIEVWAEKLLYTGHCSLHLLSQLKKGALLGDVNALVSNVRTVRTAFERNEDAVNTQLAGMKLEVQELLGGLEHSYYSSQHRGRLKPAEAGAAGGAEASQLQELCQLAWECSNKGQS